MVEVETISIVFTGLSISLAAFYYISTLRNTQRTQQLQLETRQAQLLMQIYNNWRNAEQLRLFAKSFLMEWDSYEDFQSKYSIDNFEERLPFTSMSYFFEGVGVLVEEGLLDIRLVAKLISGDLIMHWERFEPIIREHRERRNYQQYFDKVEFLYDQVIKLRGQEWVDKARIDITKE